MLLYSAVQELLMSDKQTDACNNTTLTAHWQNSLPGYFNSNTPFTKGFTLCVKSGERDPLGQVKALLDWLWQSCRLGVLYDSRLSKLPHISTHCKEAVKLPANLTLPVTGCCRNVNDSSNDNRPGVTARTQITWRPPTAKLTTTTRAWKIRGRPGLTHLRSWLNI